MASTTLATTTKYRVGETQYMGKEFLFDVQPYPSTTSSIFYYYA